MYIKTDLYAISLFKMDKRKREELSLKEKVDLMKANNWKSQRKLANYLALERRRCFLFFLSRRNVIAQLCSVI
jgi:hypothetical protein